MEGQWLGAALALAAAACFATGNVLIVKAAGARGDRGSTLSVLITAAMAGPLWLVWEDGALPAAADPRLTEALVWFGVSGLFAMALGRALVFTSIRRLGATRASAVKRVNPFFSVVLAWALLGETVSGLDAVGMALIAAAFAVMIRRSFRRAEAEENPPPAADYGWGVAGSLCYASSYVARKLGLAAAPLPLFGTLVSALAGLVAIAALGLFVRRFRDNLLNAFRWATPWTVAAGVTVSMGQILTFAALFHAEVMTVVMISSLEMFISNAVAVLVFRTETRAHWSVLLGAALAGGGAIAVASG